MYILLGLGIRKTHNCSRHLAETVRQTKCQTLDVKLRPRFAWKKRLHTKNLYSKLDFSYLKLSKECS